jgi:hypothetical protein
VLGASQGCRAGTVADCWGRGRRDTVKTAVVVSASITVEACACSGYRPVRITAKAGVGVAVGGDTFGAVVVVGR